MPKKIHKPEEVVAKLGQVDVLVWQGQTTTDAIRSIGVTELNTLVTMALFAAQYAMIWVGLDLMPGNSSSTGGVEDLNRLGSWLGAMAQSNGDQGPDLTPIENDLKTAAHLGTRVAEVTSRLRR